MRKLEVHSVLAEPIQRFVEYKRALNRKYRSEAAALRLFDQYLCDTAVAGWDEIDGLLIGQFLKTRPRVRPRSYNHLLGVLRRFFAWTVVQGLVLNNPVTAQRRRDAGQRLPYLFQLYEAKRLLELARALPNRSRAPHRGLVYEMIFSLLYGLGIRVGEASRLKLGDVDFSRDTLFIRDTKFSKSRLVPFGPKLGQQLRGYVAKRYGETLGADLPLFSFTKRGCISENTISQTFHMLVPKLGLHIPPGASPPRAHDLRHSFAVGTLLRWYREGIDPNSRLIHLSMFLGHVDPASTAVYLTITDDLLREADQRFRLFALNGAFK
jgi:integrase